MILQESKDGQKYLMKFSLCGFRCLELRSCKEFGCLLSWNRAGEFEFEIRFKQKFGLNEKFLKYLKKNLGYPLLLDCSVRGFLN